MDIYITFDPYYDIKQYNEFISAAKNNGIDYYEYISVRPPYLWYIKIDMDDVPRFINYDLIDGSQKKFLTNIMKPRYPNEAHKLLRREADNPKDIERFVSPLPLIQARKEEYVCFFKVFNKDELIQTSKALGNAKIWRLGNKTKRKGYVYMTFNPYVKSFINSSNILLEKESKSDMNNVGELEYTLNHKVLVTEKLDGKAIELEYFQNGKFYPLKAPQFL